MIDDVETIGAALGRIPSGCSILTASHEGRSTGVLVSWVQQATFQPPSVTVCLKQGRPIAKLLDAAERFLLNLIGEDPTSLFRHFGKGYTLEEEAFSGLSVRETSFGPLIESCIAHVGCAVTQKVTLADHDLYVGEVMAAGVVDGAEPYVHVRRSGLTY